MNTELEDKITHYLTNMAEQNPTYLPTAMAQVMILRMELMLMDCWRKAIEAYLGQMQAEFNKLIESMGKEEADD